ncbi:cytochrome P450 [Gilbertella persicaria]|uniref:cytochrome P450 n=1 Tax=Gilbertella persicaria TaxID=101096 RepID=UPI00221E7E3C|nr:cytochrome P450 [Gilbertella persicaria]KAI8054196.1 cytochrome P450 [Gilbertella persicaria]
MDHLTERNMSIALSTVAFAFTLIKCTSYLIQDKDKDLPPLVPYRIPFIGSTFKYYLNPPAFTRQFTEKYGSVFRMHLHGDLVTVVGAGEADEVFHHPDLSFLASQSKFLSNAFFHGGTEFTLPENTIHEAIMKHLTPNLKEYSPRAFEIFLKDVNTQEKEFEKSDLLPFFRSFVARYSASAFVGLHLCQDKDLMNVFENAVADISKDFKPSALRVVFPFFNQIYMRLSYFHQNATTLKRYRIIIKNALRKEILGRDKNEPNQDVLAYLLERYPHEVDDAYLESLTTIVLILIFVGVHTTSEALTYVMYCLVKYPEYIQELRDEQLEVINEELGQVTQDDVVYTPGVYRRMMKLDSFIRECLRTRMVGIGLAHTNTSQHDVVLKSGAIVNPGREVFINMLDVHFDRENQSGQINIDTFDGFRFVGQDKLVTKAGHDNIAFGMGKHACPGRWFAIHQIKGIVSYFIRNYEMMATSEIHVMGAQSDHVGAPRGSVKFTKIN